MRVPRLTIMLTALLVVLSACAAMANVASYLPANNVPITFKFINYDTGVQYLINDTNPPSTNPLAPPPYTGEGTLNGLPQITPLGVNAGEDSWGLLYLSEIENSVDNTTVYWRAKDAAFGNTEITGLIFGGSDVYLGQSTIGSTVIQNIEANGVHMALWEDSALNFSPLAGPAGRTNPANSLPSYTGATEGTLIWTFDSVKGYMSAFDTTQTNEFLDNYTVNSANPLLPIISGGGGFWANTSTITSGANSFTGSLNSLLGPLSSSGVNIEINFTNTTDVILDAQNNPIPGPWLVKSNDPAYAKTIPEPATSVLMLLGLLPIGIRLRRRNRA